jgi:hypothetical protein
MPTSGAPGNFENPQNLIRFASRSDDRVILAGEEEEQGLSTRREDRVELSADWLMGQTPEPEACLKVGSLEKLNSESVE